MRTYTSKKLKELGTPDLMVLTHYDDDHIGGILQLVGTCLDDNVALAKEVWANCAGYVEMAENKSTNAKQGVTLSVKLNELKEKHEIIWRDDLSEGFKTNLPFASIEVVSPPETIRRMVIKNKKKRDNSY